MTRKSLIYSLLFFCISVPSFISSANACTPVVYAFRHAEDLKDVFPTKLTPEGMEHAKLYIEMVRAFEIIQDYCPVKSVYAVNPTKPGGIAGTTNPFETARPLANILTNLDPIIDIDNKQIDEFLEISNLGPVRFRGAMLDKVEDGSSVAVFWTSQGLPNLGRAIAPGFDIPETPKPPRNAAYIFRFNGSDGFIAPPKPTQDIQCFNWTIFRAPDDFSSSKYFCASTAEKGNISDKIRNFLYKLHGRICDTDHLMAIEPPQPGYYGYCLSPATP